MIVDKKLKNYFINLMISEDQAIGIYEAELFLNISPKEIFRKILLEEISISKSSVFSERSLDNSFIVFLGIMTPGTSLFDPFVVELAVASL